MLKTTKEDEYILRLEKENLKKKETEKQKRLEEGERQQLKELHYMCCPKCGMRLIELDYQDIKIDQCSGCQGIWLDQGELEHIVALEKNKQNSLFKIFKK